jgi:predicted nucleotidyltransferase component of viral defense system
MNIFENMLKDYVQHSESDRLNAIHEVMQQVALCGLSKSGFFQHAAFYGGTCLRIFHGLDRFSEDLDFSLLQSNPNFSLQPHLDSIVHEFEAMGQSVQVSEKPKSNQTQIKSAFLKSTTAQYNIHLERDRSIKIKIEVDTLPPLAFDTELKLLLQPSSFYTNCFVLPDLYAGKMHALIFRTWKNRIKGRDWYDFEWYVKKKIPLNLQHFSARAFQSNPELPENWSQDDFLDRLRDKIQHADINQIKQDVIPFIKDLSHLDIWSTDYFLQLSNLITFA